MLHRQVGHGDDAHDVLVHRMRADHDGGAVRVRDHAFDLEVRLVELSDGALVEEILDGVVILENGFNNREVPTKHVQLGLGAVIPLRLGLLDLVPGVFVEELPRLGCDLFRLVVVFGKNQAPEHQEEPVGIPALFGRGFKRPLAFSRGLPCCRSYSRGSHLRPPWRRVGEACPTQA